VNLGSTVLDAHAVLCLLHEEAAAPVVAERLERAVESDELLPMCTVSWGEVVYRVAQSHQDRTSEAAGIIDTLPIALVDADRVLAARAALLKATHGLGYADSFAAALAMLLDAPLMTGDRDFLPLQEHGLELEFLAEG
jgi:predicted nucleic acid-binding protein